MNGAKLYHCPFEIGLCSGKGGHGRLGRVETGLLSRTLPIRPQHTGETRCAPLLKSKSKRLLVLRPFWDGFGVGFLRVPGADLRRTSWLMERISLRMDSSCLLVAKASFSNFEVNPPCSRAQIGRQENLIFQTPHPSSFVRPIYHQQNP